MLSRVNFLIFSRQFPVFDTAVNSASQSPISMKEFAEIREEFRLRFGLCLNRLQPYSVHNTKASWPV